MSGYWFLSSPYTLYPGGLDEAARIAAENSALLRQAKVSNFSPIVHGHAISQASGIDPIDAVFWMNGDRPMLHAAKGMIVLMMDGWDESAGVDKELKTFRKACKPVIYMAPGAVPPELVRG